MKVQLECSDTPKPLFCQFPGIKCAYIKFGQGWKCFACQFYGMQQPLPGFETKQNNERTSERTQPHKREDADTAGTPAYQGGADNPNTPLPSTSPG